MSCQAGAGAAALLRELTGCGPDIGVSPVSSSMTTLHSGTAFITCVLKMLTSLCVLPLLLSITLQLYQHMQQRSIEPTVATFGTLITIASEAQAYDR